MAAKKRQARGKQKPAPSFRWLKPLLATTTVLGSAAGLALLAGWMNDPYEWPVNQVHIEGEFIHLDRSGLQRQVAPLAGEGFFAMDVGAIQARIQALPWVMQASVRRVWPDRLDIRVVEQQPVARWGEDAFLNARAEVFRPDEAAGPAALPRLQGPDGHERRVLEMCRRVQDMLEPLGLAVDRLQLDARRAWHLQLANGLRMEIGRNDPLPRVARFVRMYPAVLAAHSGRIVSVDLRYSNGFAVLWQDADETARGTG